MAENPLAWVEPAARTCPDRPALRDSQRLLNYRGLATELRRLAGMLKAAGPGATLAVLSRSRWTSALLTLAAPAAGVTPFPLSPDLPQVERGLLLARAGVTLACADANTVLPPSIRRLDPERETSSHGRPLRAAEVQLILATSGSSGVPKGVMLSGANLAAGVRAFLGRFALRPGDLWLDCLPLFHIGGLAILYRCFAVGATVLLHERFDAEQLWADLRSEGVTHLSLVPAMLSRLLDAAGDRPPPAGLKTVLLGGGPLSASLAERALDAGWPVCVSYGMTETSALCAAVCLAGVAREEGVAGFPLQGFGVRIGNGDPGETGVIRLRGPAVMCGYLNPERVPGEGLVDGWFETSDLGRLDSEGRLRVLGRVDDMLLSGGELVPPAQVESLLLSCPGVRAVAVVGIPDPSWGEVTAAWVVGEWGPTALDAWCRANLPTYLRPRRWFRVEALPETVSGKLDRRKLRDQAR